jgi:hypothetical protein
MKYYAPVVEVELFDAVDVITTSGGGSQPYEGPAVDLPDE